MENAKIAIVIQKVPMVPVMLPPGYVIARMAGPETIVVIVSIYRISKSFIRLEVYNKLQFVVVDGK